MHNALRLLTCLGVALTGCVLSRSAQPTRSVSLPEFAEIIEGRKVTLPLSKDKCLYVLPLSILVGFTAGRVLDRKKARRRYVFESSASESLQIIEHVLR